MASLPDTFLVTDGRGDLGRLRAILGAAIAGGIRGVQVRENGLSARQVAMLCEEWKPKLDEVGGVLIVNDRADVVAAGLAHGVQLGHRSLGPAEVRRFLPESALVGLSVHVREDLRETEGVDFLVLAPLFSTGSKPGAVTLGEAGARAFVTAADRPVILLGGIDPGNVGVARRIGAFGVAVMSAVCDATDPCAAAAALVARGENA